MATDVEALPTDLLSPAQVAQVLGIARTALYGLATRRALPHHRVGRLIRFRERDIAAYLAGTRVEAAERRDYVRYPQV
ncbi:MAG: helix-turn-helix domain-containing protein [Polyangiales bacterium]